MYSPTENPLSAYRRFRAQTAFIEHLRIQSGLLALAVIINILILYLLQTAGVWLLRGWFRRFPPVLLSSDAVCLILSMPTWCAFPIGKFPMIRLIRRYCLPVPGLLWGYRWPARS